MPDFSTASNYSIQTGPPAKDRQAIKIDPSPDAHKTTHEPMKISRQPLAPYDPSETSPMVPISR